MIYVASSWRNPHLDNVNNALRGAGHDTYDFRSPEGASGFHWSQVPAFDHLEGDSSTWGPIPSSLYREALDSDEARQGFAYDLAAMIECSTCVMVLPCGKSAHLELGWFSAAQGKRTCILLEPDVDPPELMYLLADEMVVNITELLTVMDDWRHPEEDSA